MAVISARGGGVDSSLFLNTIETDTEGCNIRDYSSFSFGCDLQLSISLDRHSGKDSALE